MLSLSVFLEDLIHDLDQPACPERWTDEIGCDDGTEHRCDERPPHRKHLCRCGSFVLEETRWMT